MVNPHDVRMSFGSPLLAGAAAAPPQPQGTPRRPGGRPPAATVMIADPRSVHASPSPQQMPKPGFAPPAGVASSQSSPGMPAQQGGPKGFGGTVAIQSSAMTPMPFPSPVTGAGMKPPAVGGV